MTSRRRCAIYTRKSTDEGLDMAFNSLDAQREACEAYVLSQRSEGWLLLPTAYDDGGFSGGSMERPALKRLMADVKAGLIDVIVVYKVDRLTRALSDFAKIVDVLDAAGASFVSVTQAFNTTSSMGRLTLNVLLSFAQFEREVIAERVRDKIAQSKARGIWMGGMVPLGYEVKDRKLIPMPDEAETVRRIFSLYLELPSVRALKERLDAEGIVTKVQNGKNGTTGGVPFARGAIYHLLANPIYIGKLRHKEKLHEGEHDGIVPLDLWQAVQQRLAQRGPEMRMRRSSAEGPALLTGMVHDHVRRPLSPNHVKKGSKRYHYYASSISHDISSGNDRVEKVLRIGAKHLDVAVRYAIISLFSTDAVYRMIEANDIPPTHLPAALAAAGEWMRSIPPSGGLRIRQLLQDLRFVASATYTSITATIDEAALLAMLLREPMPDDDEQRRVDLPLPIEHRQRGKEMKLVLSVAARPAAEPDERLVQLIVKAHSARRQIFEGETSPSDRHLWRLARLAYLAPDITTAILEGRQPRSLSSRTLAKMGQLPLDWAEQRRVLGFRNARREQ